MQPTTHPSLWHLTLLGSLCAIVLVGSATGTHAQEKAAKSGKPLVYAGARSFYYGGLGKASVAYEEQTGQRVLLIPGGCKHATKAVKKGKADVGALCCPLNAKDQKAAGTQIPLAWEALTVIVNKKNPVSSLTAGQIRDIFRGNITNWKQVGGANRPIAVYTRLHCKGRDGHWKLILPKRKDFITFKNKKLKKTHNFKEEQALVLKVRNNPDSIGHGAIMTSNPKYVKILKVDGYAPTPANLKSGKYTWYRPITLTAKARPTPKQRAFIDFLVANADKYMHPNLLILRGVVAKKKAP